MSRSETSVHGVIQHSGGDGIETNHIGQWAIITLKVEKRKQKSFSPTVVKHQLKKSNSHHFLIYFKSFPSGLLMIIMMFLARSKSLWYFPSYIWLHNLTLKLRQAKEVKNRLEKCRKKLRIGHERQLLTHILKVTRKLKRVLKAAFYRIQTARRKSRFSTLNTACQKLTLLVVF